MSEEVVKKTGLFFGSFDPVHSGHLIIAEYLVNHSDITEIWFVLSPQNPLKTNQTRGSWDARKAMLELAITETPAFNICEIEQNMQAPHYTYLTIERLKKDFPDKNFVLIIGSDNLEVFDQWKNYEQIFDMLQIYVYPRPGFEGGKFLSHKSMKKIKAPLLEISSTYIRDCFSQEKLPRYMLHWRVFDYILKKGLYFKSNQ
ncbi:MAG: nicotinate-nucleotide adenylyltransferase [Bacteroidetes bacterium]|nr:MAG: nicotinate-nucleotide adenylyltransferase [Bacteroidota bacterium]